MEPQNQLPCRRIPLRRELDCWLEGLNENFENEDVMNPRRETRTRESTRGRHSSNEKTSTAESSPVWLKGKSGLSGSASHATVVLQECLILG